MLEKFDPTTGKTIRDGDDCRPTCAGCADRDRKLIALRGLMLKWCRDDDAEAQRRIAELGMVEG